MSPLSESDKFDVAMDVPTVNVGPVPGLPVLVSAPLKPMLLTAVPAVSLGLIVEFAVTLIALGIAVTLAALPVNVPPLSTTVLPVPRAPLLPTPKMPSLTVILPVNVLLPAVIPKKGRN